MASTRAKRNWLGWAGTALVIGALAIPLVPYAPAMLRALQGISPHAPDWALWARLPVAVQLHVVSALAALVIGTVILLRPKGTGFHKTLGWGWVAAMGTAAASSLFITGLNGNFYSLIHLLSGWTIIGLPMAIFAIRNRKVDAHKRAMTGMYVGGLLLAGALTFLPGRFMFQFLLG